MSAHRAPMLPVALVAGALILGLAVAPVPGLPGAAGNSSSAAAAPAAGTPFVPAVQRRRATIWALGDGADAGGEGAALATMIAARRIQRFVYLGDVYTTGTGDEFQVNYRPLFGRFDPIAAPTIGNHEYANRADGYEPYWEAARGLPAPRWYSFSAAGWQLISLNSLEPMDEGSEQLAWLSRRLARTPRFGSCRIAFTHYPRYSAGSHGDHDEMEPVWQLLQGRARLLLAGHDHDLERFRPVGGLIQMISGAGGISLRDANEADPRTAFVADDHFGALRLELRRGWAVASFVSIDGEVLDRKPIHCARRPAG